MDNLTDDRYLERAERALRRSESDLDWSEAAQALAVLSIATSLHEISERLTLMVERQGYAPARHGGEH